MYSPTPIDKCLIRNSILIIGDSPKEKKIRVQREQSLFLKKFKNYNEIHCSDRKL
jgi:hypothetical protein